MKWIPFTDEWFGPPEFHTPFKPYPKLGEFGKFYSSLANAAWAELKPRS